MFSNFSQRGTIKEVFYSCIILSTSLLVGINRSYLAFLFYQLDLPDSSITVDDEQKSWIAAFINLLSPFGCIVAGILMDAYGRKISVQGIFVPFLVSWLMIALAKNVSMLYMATLIQSISIGRNVFQHCHIRIRDLNSWSSRSTSRHHRDPLKFWRPIM